MADEFQSDLNKLINQIEKEIDDIRKDGRVSQDPPESIFKD